MTYKRESAAQIAERLRRGKPTPRPVFVSERLPIEGMTISWVGQQ